MNIDKIDDKIELLASKLQLLYADKQIYGRYSFLYIDKISENATNRITFYLNVEDVLILFEEKYDPGCKQYQRLVIEEPHFENLVNVIQLYFELGKGADPNNPLIGELINITKNYTKSVKNINL